ncbi:sperm acrosome-associated protein 7 [Cricetulus griseus]|uniref:Sperm acrosome-associated protein 7 n=1 Tax=Cricetulus griseus TaxID=10029 RepID=A0A9J7J285_CRIGR|nr:sperm acrosome-associated protein 7 [Cricetulus griseus]XP_027244021.1 sperm acrosome-associated protein 7 [Cricetulus griseus]
MDNMSIHTTHVHTADLHNASIVITGQTQDEKNIFNKVLALRSCPVTDDTLKSTTDDIPEVFDEILAQEILEPNTTAVSEAPTTKKATITSVSTKEKISGVDENYQEDSSENYHELLENLELTSMNKEKNDGNDRSTAENIHEHSSQTKVEPHFSYEEKKNTNNDKKRKVSVLDRILQNIGRSEGNLELTGKWPLICRSLWAEVK